MTKTSKIILWVVIIVVVLGGIYFALSYKPSPAAAPTGTIPAGTVCTMDAKQCPDGTYVGRTGPNCEFVCPGAATSSKNAGVPIIEGNVDSSGTVTTYPADIGK